MPLKDYQQKILDLLKDKELALSELYKEISEKFYQNEEFWSNLSEEKLYRLQQIEELCDQVKQEKMGFDEKKTKTYTLYTFMESIQDIKDQLRNNELNEIKALSLCHDLENSILERRVYEYFIPYNDKQKAVLDKLKIDINDYLKNIQAQKNKIVSG
ncbi:hypothetical protein Flexsi_1880 [Flexistipes sinusarabici DSM 4947]|uniref:Uncharacterized protein n=1 Tax=Flexistipes sinusarabici (strain ATCC 49648 / DSM 4947 / MAS 10) TaxID=717231 RepID=F8E489_FLESM|nr:hypothetical protein [Flexistipes sinusarabici]AEI15516.1 hypothetical protein Flexsi_1880 [Flexistipes sinusarabici DSM 4947]